MAMAIQLKDHVFLPSVLGINSLAILDGLKGLVQDHWSAASVLEVQKKPTSLKKVVTEIFRRRK